MTLIDHFRKKQYILTEPLNIFDFINIKFYADKNWFLHIYKEYNEDILQVVFDWLLENEEYEKCQKLFDQVTNYNKYFNKNIKIDYAPNK